MILRYYVVGRYSADVFSFRGNLRLSRLRLEASIFRYCTVQKAQKEQKGTGVPGQIIVACMI